MSAVKAVAVPRNPINKALEDRHFKTVIRQVKNASMGKVKPLQTAAFNNLKRLGVKKDLSKAVKGLPNGSDQWDAGSILTWMAKINPKDDDAIVQLQAIHATCSVRAKGN